MIESKTGHRLPRTLAMGGVLAFALFACGGGEPTTEEIATMDQDEVAERAKEIKDLSGLKACELLTAAEIEAATGIAAGQPEDISQVQGQLPMCRWPSADGSEYQIVNLLVTRSMFASYDEFVATTREQLGTDFSEEDWQRVDDIGDFGVWLPEDYAGGMLQLYDEGMMIQVDAETAEGRDELAASKELALKAFDRVE